MVGICKYLASSAGSSILMRTYLAIGKDGIVAGVCRNNDSLRCTELELLVNNVRNVCCVGVCS